MTDTIIMTPSHSNLNLLMTFFPEIMSLMYTHPGISHLWILILSTNTTYFIFYMSGSVWKQRHPARPWIAFLHGGSNVLNIKHLLTMKIKFLWQKDWLLALKKNSVYNSILSLWWEYFCHIFLWYGNLGKKFWKGSKWL